MELKLAKHLYYQQVQQVLIVPFMELKLLCRRITYL